jgi:hypothetical protein
MEAEFNHLNHATWECRGSSESTMANPAARARRRCRVPTESMAGERDGRGRASVTCSRLRSLA